MNVEGESWCISCCFMVSATWATTPAPALWNHSFFTWLRIERINKSDGGSMRYEKSADTCSYMDVIMCKEGPESRVKADINFPPSQSLQPMYHFLCWRYEENNIVSINRGGCFIHHLVVCTFHNLMILYCVLYAGIIFSSLLCFCCFWWEMRSLGWNGGVVLHVNNVFVAIQRSPRRLSMFKILTRVIAWNLLLMCINAEA